MKTRPTIMLPPILLPTAISDLIDKGRVTLK